MENLVYLIKNIDHLLKNFDERIIKLALRRDVKCEILAERILKISNDKLELLSKYNKTLKIIKHFDEKEKIIFELHYLKGMRLVDVAQILNISERSVIRYCVKMNEKAKQKK